MIDYNLYNQAFGLMIESGAQFILIDHNTVLGRAIELGVELPSEEKTNDIIDKVKDGILIKADYDIGQAF
jgi:hypothetical protein